MLDRFLFVFFAEDKGLLQPNTVISIIAQWEKLKALDEYQPLYSRFKKHFGYLNSGYKSAEFDVFAYNGGLFAPDEILDSLEISDNLLEVHTRLMSHYDYDTDIDTNILGHIFEHSLNEIDEIMFESSKGFQPLVNDGNGNRGKGLKPLGETSEKPITKRKKDGIFYTPKYITKYIVQQTVGELCRKQKITLSLDNETLSNNGFQPIAKKERKQYLDKIAEYRAWLLQITILDPACGSGAFLNEALEFLIAEHRNIDTMQATLFGDALTMNDNVTEILENNIFGVDINEESVEIARLALWLRTAKVGRKLNDLSGHIKCGNSLISDPEVAGDLAFDWYRQFPTVFQLKDKRAFHIVLTTHNSRTSQRMIKYNVQKGEPLNFNLEQEILMTEIISSIIKEKGYYCLEYNICKDHVHLVMVCEAEELTDIVKTIKGKSAYLYNRSDKQSNGFQPIVYDEDVSGNDKGLKPLGQDKQYSKGFQPLAYSKNDNDNGLKHIGVEGKSEKSQSVWSQKFFRAFLDEWELANISNRPGWIYDDNYLENTLYYVKNNRIKHQLPASSALEKVIKSFCVDMTTAYASEYKGGFDVIIGNPPYVRQELLGETMKIAFSKAFPKVYNGVADLYVYFYNQGINLLKDQGVLGYITPNNWLEKKYGFELRNFLKPLKIEKLVDYGELPIFEDASTEPAIIILSKEKSELNFDYATIKDIKTAQDISLYEFKKVEKENLREDIWRFASDIGTSILEKFAKNSVSLSDYTNGGVYYGIKTGFNSAFIINQEISNKIINEDINSKEILRKEVEGQDFSSWHLSFAGRYMIFFPRGKKEIENYPSIKKYMMQFYEDLLPKKSDNDKRGRKAGTYNWFETQDIVAYYKDFEKPKLIYYHTALKHSFYYDTEGYYLSNNCYFIGNADRYLQCILNSKVFHFCKKYLFPSFGDVEKGGRVRLDANKMATLPIRKIDENLKAEFVVFAEKITESTAIFQKKSTQFQKLLQSNFSNLLINKKLEMWSELTFGELKKELEKQKNVLPLKQQMEWQQLFEEEKAVIQQLSADIKSTDQAIDKLVYALYELTAEEIQIIENA